jgi:hypothetical protein
MWFRRTARWKRGGQQSYSNENYVSMRGRLSITHLFPFLLKTSAHITPGQWNIFCPSKWGSVCFLVSACYLDVWFHKVNWNGLVTTWFHQYSFPGTSFLLLDRSWKLVYCVAARSHNIENVCQTVMWRELNKAQMMFFSSSCMPPFMLIPSLVLFFFLSIV